MGILICRLTAAIQLHNTLHSFRTVRGTGTTPLEAKPLQQMMDMREKVLCEIFLDLHKAYYALDRGHCLDILTSYGVGPGDLRLLRRYWACLSMVAMSGGYFGAPLKGQQIVTQGETLYTTIFNVVVDAVLRHWVYTLAAMDGAGDPGK